MLQRLAKCSLSLRRSGLLFNQNRTLFISATNRVKEIVVSKDSKDTVIEGVISESPRVHHLLNVPPQTHGCENEEACSVCRLNLEIKHTDVLILSQFIRMDGCMLPRRVTGLCRLQQKRISKMVVMALKAGLMPNRSPYNSKRDPAMRDKFKKNHRYYDESTIWPPRKLKYPTA